MSINDTIWPDHATIVERARRLETVGLVDRVDITANAGNPRDTIIAIDETVDRPKRTFHLRGSNLDGLDGYLNDVDDFPLTDLTQLAACLPAAEQDLYAICPDYVQSWLDQLAYQPKRLHAARYCAWQLGLADRPTPCHNWAHKAERRADRLFAEPFERANR